MYNIARMLPYQIPISVIMAHFSTYARPCVHKMTCKSDKLGVSVAYLALSFYKVSPEMDENSEELRNFFLGIESSTILCTA